MQCVVSPPAGTSMLDSFNAYPSRLQRDLASRYRMQDIRVVNAGVPGQQASKAVGRFAVKVRRGEDTQNPTRRKRRKIGRRFTRYAATLCL